MVNRRCKPAARFIKASTLPVTLGTEAVLGLIYSLSQAAKNWLLQTASSSITELQQEGRKPVISGLQLYGGPASDSLTLQWYMDFQLSWYPWQKFSSLFYEQTYGVMMERGLVNFKKQLIK